MLCLGHRGDLIEAFIEGNGLPERLSIECVRTGEGTPTGGRIALVRERLEGDRICATYADGVADLDLAARLPHRARCARHHDGGASGAPCFEPEVFDYLDEESVLEREPPERLASERQPRAYRHTGFWDCMDTYKDAVLLNDLWAADGAPWKELHRLRRKPRS